MDGQLPLCRRNLRTKLPRKASCSIARAPAPNSGPQPLQSGAPSRHSPSLQTKTSRRLGRVARPRGLMAASVWACCAMRRRPAVTLTKPLGQLRTADANTLTRLHEYHRLGGLARLRAKLD